MAEKKKRKVSQKSKANLIKGQVLMEKAVTLAKKDGTKTIPAKTVYKKPMSYYLKQAASK